jgi:hypothetical protein
MHLTRGVKDVALCENFWGGKRGPSNGESEWPGEATMILRYVKIFGGVTIRPCSDVQGPSWVPLYMCRPLPLVLLYI